MQDILKILKAGIDSIDGEKAVFNNLKRTGNRIIIVGKSFNLEKFKNIYILGIGKVSEVMANGLEKILGQKITKGLVVSKKRLLKLKQVKQILGSHPVPDKKSLKAGSEILSIAKKATEKDLVIVLLSGGASALAVSPKGISLKEKQNLTKELLACGADIKEINILRKNLSNIKGGALAKAIYPATCLTLIISDVLGNDLSTIGSGPTVFDKSKHKDCLRILKKYKLEKKFPNIYKKFLGKEEPKDKKYFKDTHNFIIADLDLALAQAKKQAERLGYNSKILKRKITGIASGEGEKLAKEVNKIKPKFCQISGGETTVILTGKGKGGRNLELALGFLKKAKDLKNIQLLSAGTDGDDGISGVAGVIADQKVLEKSKKLNINKYLKDNNSLEFFEKTGKILKYPQRTNVGDIQILLKK